MGFIIAHELSHSLDDVGSKYDKNGNETETIYQFWKENNWKKVSRVIYTYDDKNRVLTQLNYNNSEDNWKENQKSEWEYSDTVSSVITFMMYDKWTPNDKSLSKLNQLLKNMVLKQCVYV